MDHVTRFESRYSSIYGRKKHIIFIYGYCESYKKLLRSLITQAMCITNTIIIVVSLDGSIQKVGYTHQAADAKLSFHKVYSWTFDMSSTESLVELAEAKHYYAGGSCRFMSFRYKTLKIN